jgi:chemotaxis protein MotB
MSRHRRHQRHREEEAENHERWLVSYADFITLLFAFFVVMYAVSSVNEGKYRILSDSIVSAFRNVPGSSSGAQVAVTPAPPLVLPMIVPNRPALAAKVGTESKRPGKEKLRDMAQEIKTALGPLVDSGQVRITEGARGITVDINASVLFAPGEARLGNEALAPLVAVARILAPTDFPITVEGHTDNIPIATPQFASNWELSGARASSVVRQMIEHGVAASRLMAVGYADQRPVAENDLAEGRARNRRVAITIESTLPDQAAAESVSALMQSGAQE